MRMKPEKHETVFADLSVLHFCSFHLSYLLTLHSAERENLWDVCYNCLLKTFGRSHVLLN